MNALDAFSVLKPADDRPSGSRILHISADFPDPIEESKTKAVRWLVDLTQHQFQHEVISLNRVSPALLPFAARTLAHWGRPPCRVEQHDFPYGKCLRYQAPARGIYHQTCLLDLAERICAQQQAGPVPDLVIGHKLTVEGIVARHVAERLGRPFAVGIMGDTDLKILKARPDLAGTFARIFHEAAVVFPLAPWTLTAFEQQFGKRHGPVQMLPCATDIDRPMDPQLGGDGFVSVFHLRSHVRKNLKGMVAAMQLLSDVGPKTRLSVRGGGSPRQVELCRKAAKNLPNITFDGPIGREELGPFLNGFAGFLLPSLRESFGMVFVEALFAGLPVIYPRGAAIDGYFEGCNFAIAADAGDPASIAAAMRTIIDHQAELKGELAQWQQSPAARRFTRAQIGQSFAAAVTQAVMAR
ncbi:hypothetical protein GCM10009127_03050 [Alteraurantiacibacter aestuarii]|uniref:Glycosyltransferase n=1 Tax=Alteraurantiacibacter aestuarii TaxID=650004 RepID=A0A844ZIY5_9SPHN|nr:glycosyltransferase [Alteraurantiacibacter aestuarii]MXO88441.1 glycosyltransferase [Alteraurantiacibacter aestuarii]